MADIIVEALFRSMLFECYRIKATGCQWVPGNYLTGRWSRILGLRWLPVGMNRPANKGG